MKPLLFLIVSAACFGQAVLDNFATSRNNGNGNPVWQIYAGESVGQSDTISGGLFNVVGSPTTAAIVPITSITQTNPAIITAPGATWQSQIYLGNQTGDTVTITGATGTGCSGINGQWNVLKLSANTFSIWTNQNFDVGVDGTGCTYSASSGTGQACLVIGCGIYWQFLPQVPGGYEFPQSFTQAYILSGTWNPNFNRLTYTMACDNSLPEIGTGQTLWNMGDYVRAHAVSLSNFQGEHYYRGFDANVNSGITMQVETSSVVDHEVSQADNIINYPANIAFWLPDYNDMSGPVNQFDGQTRFYNQNDSPGYSNHAMWSGNTCHYGNFQYAEVDHQSDAYAHQVISQYTGGHYEVTFAGAKSSAGFIPTTYQIRYSTTNLLTLGFSNGTSGGTVMSPGSAYMQTYWSSGAMAQAPVLYVGIRPVMNIRGLVNSTPIQLYTEAESGLQTGDTVMVGSVGGATAANGNWTVTALPAQSFTIGGSTLTSVVCATNVCTATTPNPHGLSVGQLAMDVFVTQTEYQIASVPTTTTFTWACSGCTGTWNSMSNPNTGIYIYAGFSLNGSTSGSAWTPNTGTAIATTDTANFRQVIITSSSPPSLTCDLNHDGVVNSVDVQLMTNQVLGISACTNDLSQTGVCTVVDIQRVINASLGGMCRIGP